MTTFYQIRQNQKADNQQGHILKVNGTINQIGKLSPMNHNGRKYSQRSYSGLQMTPQQREAEMKL